MVDRSGRGSVRSMGISVWIITGDNRATAEAVAATAGVPRGKVLANVLPADKARKVIYAYLIYIEIYSYCSYNTARYLSRLRRTGK